MRGTDKGSSEQHTVTVKLRGRMHSWLSMVNHEDHENAYLFADIQSVIIAQSRSGDYREAVFRTRHAENAFMPEPHDKFQTPENAAWSIRRDDCRTSLVYIDTCYQDLIFSPPHLIRIAHSTSHFASLPALATRSFDPKHAAPIASVECVLSTFPI